MKTIKPRGGGTTQPGNMAMNPEIWRYIIDSIEDPVFLHDAQFRVTMANRAYCRAAGMTESEVLGNHYWDIFPQCTGPLPGCMEAATGKSHTGSREEVRVGEKRFISLGYTVHNEHGESLYSLHILSDITLQRQTELALAKARKSFIASLTLRVMPSLRSTGTVGSSPHGTLQQRRYSATARKK